jgi:hypothetical protein
MRLARRDAVAAAGVNSPHISLAYTAGGRRLRVTTQFWFANAGVQQWVMLFNALRPRYPVGANFP